MLPVTYGDGHALSRKWLIFSGKRKRLRARQIAYFWGLWKNPFGRQAQIR